LPGFCLVFVGREWLRDETFPAIVSASLRVLPFIDTQVHLAGREARLKTWKPTSLTIPALQFASIFLRPLTVFKSN